MTDWIGGVIQPETVNSAEEFAAYCQQRIGIPYPGAKDMAILKRKLKDFMNTNENITWATTTRLVDWARSRNKRPAHCWYLVDYSRYAWQDGYLPELDAKEPKDKLLEAKIGMALRVEDDPVWRDKLAHSKTIEVRQTIFEAWWKTRRPIFVQGIASGQ